MNNVFEFPKDKTPAQESSFPEADGIVIHVAFSETQEPPINKALARARALADVMETTGLSVNDATLLLPNEPSPPSGGTA